MFIAHKSDDGKVQLLKDHLEGVAKLAEEFAKPFCAENHARRAALLHDAGKYGAAGQRRIRELLWDKLPEVLTDRQKEVKITSLLSSLRDKRVIRTDSSNQQKSHWILVDPNRDAN